MITLERRGKYGSLYEIDICPTVDIEDLKKKHWLTRRPRVVARVALYPETNDWVLGPIVHAYRDTRQALVDENALESDIQTSEDSRRPLDMSGIRDGEYGLRERRLLNLWSSDIFKQIESRKQADVYEQIATRKLGPYVVGYLVKNYPEMVEDPILQRSINAALMRTKHDVNIAVEARKVHQLPKDSEAIQRISWAIRKKTKAVGEAMIDTMVHMDYLSGQYQLERQHITKEEKASISTELFLDSVRAAYPELPEL